MGHAGWQCRPHEGLATRSPRTGRLPERRLRRPGRRRRLRPGGPDRERLHRADARRLARDRRRRHPGRLPHLQLRRAGPYRRQPSGLSPARARAGKSTTTHTTSAASGSATTTRKSAAGSPSRGPTMPWSPSRSQISPGGTPAGSPLTGALTTPTRPPSQPCSAPCCKGPGTARRAAPSPGSGPWRRSAPALPGPASPAALPAAAGDGYDRPEDDHDEDRDEAVTGTVVGFGLFDPLDGQDGYR